MVLRGEGVCGFGCLFRQEYASVLLTKPWIASTCVGSFIEPEMGIANIFVAPLGFFDKYSLVINIRVFDKYPVP
jgi:hypothetical protein